MEESEKSSRFQPPKNPEDEAILLAHAKLKSTQYKNKRAVDSFKNYQMRRVTKFAVLESGVFKDYDIHSLKENLEGMDTLSLNYWLTKSVQEVANKPGGHYPTRTALYGIVCGLKRHLEEQNGVLKYHCAVPILSYPN